MISTSHLLIGAALGAATKNPAGAFFIGVASHYVADAIPHCDIGTFRSKDRKHQLNFTKSEYCEAYADLVIGGLAILLIITRMPADMAVNAFWGAAGGISIDIIFNVPYWSDYLRKWPVFKWFHQLHQAVAFDLQPKYWFWGILSQVILAGASLFYLLQLSGIIR